MSKSVFLLSAGMLPMLGLTSCSSIDNSSIENARFINLSMPPRVGVPKRALMGCGEARNDTDDEESHKDQSSPAEY